MPEAYDEFVRIGNQLEAPLPRRPGPRVHDRARPAVHAPDPDREADRRGGREDRRPDGRRGRDHEAARPSSGSSPRRSTSCCARPFDQGALKGATEGRQRASTRRRARPSARAVFDADTRRRVGRARRAGDPRPGRDLARRLPRHGRQPGRSSPPAAARRRHAAVVARQIGKPCVAGSADLLVDYANKQAACNVTGTEFKEGDWVSLDGSTGALYLGALPTVEARFEDQPELQQILGWADEIRRHGRLDQRRQARGGRAGPQLRRRGHRPLPHRAHVPRGRSPRDRARRHPRRRWRRPGPRRRPPAAARSRPRTQEVVSTLRRRDGQARAAPAGRLRGHLQGDGRPAGRRPADRPAAPRVPPEPRGAAGQGHPRRDAPVARPRRTSGCSRRSSRCTSRTRCSACAAAAWG